MANVKEYHGIQIDLDRDERIDHFGMDLLRKYYMLEEEKSPQEAFARAAIAYCYDDLGLAQRIYDYVSKGWAMYSSPVLSNAVLPGKKVRALGISCYLLFVDDSIKSLLDHTSEERLLSVLGGGIGASWSAVRSVDDLSPGPIPFLRTIDSDVVAYRQGKTRRASYAAYMDVSHPDIMEFINFRVPTGDANRKCFNLHNAVNITDAFMEAVVKDEDWNLIDPHDKTIRETVKARELWERILTIRFLTGEPYLCFIDEANRKLPEKLKEKGLKINNSNLCVAGNQRVSSDRGLLTAEELAAQGGELLLFDNEKVVKSSPMTLIEKDADVYRITLDNGMMHDITSYHQVKTAQGVKSYDELEIGDRVAIQTEKGLFGSTDLRDEAFLLGLYQADGTQHKDIIMLDIWENDFDLEAEIQAKFNKIFYKYGCDTYKIKNQVGQEVGTRTIKPPQFKECMVSQSTVRKKRLASKTLHKALDFKKGNVPGWIWKANEETIWEYIRGLFYADGTVNITQGKGNPLYLSLCSINKGFLEQVQLLLANLGLQTSLRIAREAGQQLLPDGRGGQKYYQTQEAWRIIIGNKNDALTFEKHTKFLTRKNKKVEDRVYRDNTKKFFKVIKKEYLGKQDVYCCTVDSNEHLWICNGVITHNCSEIFLPTSNERTAVCCLSSLNLETYDEWKDTKIVGDMIRFLDNVLQHFIDHAPPELHKAKYSAERERSLGLGTFGWHSYLQKNMVPFESALAKVLNTNIFGKIKKESVIETQILAEERGEYPDGIGSGRRNSHLLAIAPNANSSIIAQASPSIEPIKSNAYSHKTRAGTFLVRNKYLQTVLEQYMPAEDKNKWLDEIWSSIILNEGSVQHLDFLPQDIKDVFKTAFELNQEWIITHAADRQQFICQGQSVNLFFPAGSDRAYVNKIHLMAWKSKLKGLYYLRTSSGITADKVSIKHERVPLADYAVSSEENCIACQG